MGEHWLQFETQRPGALVGATLMSGLASGVAAFMVGRGTYAALQGIFILLLMGTGFIASSVLTLALVRTLVRKRARDVVLPQEASA